MKQILTSSLIASLLSLPVQIPQIVYAQSNIEQTAIEDMATRVHFNYDDSSFFFPDGTLDIETLDVLRMFDGIIRDSPDNNKARLQRALINYNKFNNKLGAKEDFEYLIEQGVEGLNEYAESINSLDGRIIGRMTNNDGDNLEGVAGLFDGYRWTFDFVKNGEFILGYNYERLKQGSNLPVFLFSQGKEPARVKVTVSESKETNLERVVLKPKLNCDINIIGCAYTFVGETPEDFKYGIVLEPNKHFFLRENRLLDLRTNREGFFSTTISSRWAYSDKITLDSGVLLNIKQVKYMRSE